MTRQGILKVCQHYVEPPLCAAGVSGGLLRKRIEDIMTNPILSKLPVAKRCLLSLAALLVIAAPIALGLTGGAGVALAATTNAVEMKHYRNDMEVRAGYSKAVGRDAARAKQRPRGDSIQFAGKWHP